MLVIKLENNKAQINVYQNNNLCFISNVQSNIYLNYIEIINYLLDNECYEFVTSGFSTTQKNILQNAFVKSQHFIDVKDKNKIFFQKNRLLMLNSFNQSKKTAKQCIEFLIYCLSVIKKMTFEDKTLYQKEISNPLVIDLFSDIKHQFRKNKKLNSHLSEFNLFCDGSVKEKIGETKIGGYIATKKDILKIFSENIDNQRFYDVNETEMYAIYHGLLLVKSLNISKIKVFSDSSVAIEKISLHLEGKKTNEKYNQVLSLIKEQVKDIEVKFHHITRRYNKYADYLTH